MTSLDAAYGWTPDPWESVYKTTHLYSCPRHVHGFRLRVDCACPPVHRMPLIEHARRMNQGNKAVLERLSKELAALSQ